MTFLLPRSFFRKLCPRFNMIDFTSSIVLLSNFGDARVMKQMKSSQDEHTAVTGVPQFLSTFIASLIVSTSPWIVKTKISWNHCKFCEIHQLNFYLQLDFSKTRRRVFIAAIPLERFLSLSTILRKDFSISCWSIFSQLLSEISKCKLIY